MTSGAIDRPPEFFVSRAGPGRGNRGSHRTHSRGCWPDRHYTGLGFQEPGLHGTNAHRQMFLAVLKGIFLNFQCVPGRLLEVIPNQI